MTEYERLENKLRNVEAELRRLAKNGGGDIDYIKGSYFNDNCRVLKNHAFKGRNKEKNTGFQWDMFTKIAKSLFGVKRVDQLTKEEGDICVEFLDKCVDLLNEYEAIAQKYIEDQEKAEKEQEQNNV